MLIGLFCIKTPYLCVATTSVKRYYAFPYFLAFHEPNMVSLHHIAFYPDKVTDAHNVLLRSYKNSK